MSYELVIEHRAEKDLKKLEPPLFNLIIAEIKDLSGDSHPPNNKKIMGSKNYWRLKIGDCRVLYEIENKNRVIKIMKVKHRREVYRNNWAEFESMSFRGSDTFRRDETGV